MTNTNRTSSAAHTPLPWWVEDSTDIRAAMPHLGCNGIVAETHNFTVPDAQAEANAAFIVAACNSHDALVYALKRALAVISQHHPEDSNCCAADITTIRAALAQAQGEVTR